MNPKPDFAGNPQSRYDDDCKECGPPPSPIDSQPTSIFPSTPSAMINCVPSSAFPSLIVTITSSAYTAKNIVVTEMEAPLLLSRNP